MNQKKLVPIPKNVVLEECLALERNQNMKSGMVRVVVEVQLKLLALRI
jgi:hypothetical protein